MVPLEPCTEHEAGRQLTLLSEVIDLEFDEQGHLWVADYAEFTIRDPATLQVLERAGGGVHGWVDVNTTNGEATSALGAKWSRDRGLVIEEWAISEQNERRRIGDGGSGPDPLVFVQGGRFRQPLYQRLWDTRWEPSSFPAFHYYHLDDDGGWMQDGVLYRDDGTGKGPPWMPVTHTHDHPGMTESESLVKRWIEPEDNTQLRVRALATDVQRGRVAVADDRRLAVFDSDGSLLASQPVIAATASAGLIQDRLFTVSHLELRIWDSSGVNSTAVEGAWSSAVAIDGTLIAVDRYGVLHQIDLEDGTTKPGACALESCAVSTDPAPELPSPAPNATRERYANNVFHWAGTVEGWLEARQPVLVDLHWDSAFLVAAELDDHRVSRVSVFDPAGERLLQSKDIGDHFVTRLDFPAPGTVVLAPDNLSLALPELETRRPRQREGPVLRNDALAEAAFGEWVQGDFQPYAVDVALPQLRLRPTGRIEGRRGVVSANPRHHWTLSSHSTEVWCLAPNREGQLSALPPDTPRNRTPKKGFGAPQNRNWLISRSTSAGAYFMHPDAVEASRDAVVAYWAHVPGEPVHAVVERLDDLGVPVIVLSVDPRPDDLPGSIGWEVPSWAHDQPLTLVRAGVEVWSGTEEQVPESLLTTGGHTQQAHAAPELPVGMHRSVAPETLISYREKYKVIAAQRRGDSKAAKEMAVALRTAHGSRGWEASSNWLYHATLFGEASPSWEGKEQLPQRYLAVRPGPKTPLAALRAVTDLHVVVLDSSNRNDRENSESLSWRAWPQDATPHIPRDTVFIVDGGIITWAGSANVALLASAPLRND